MPLQGGSVSAWINQLKAGDASAAQKLWGRYFERLVGLARKRLQGTPCRIGDEEDVALSVLASFCDGAARGQFPDLNDRNNLWRLLVVVTARKANRFRRDQQRQKRGGSAMLGQQKAELDLEEIIGREPTPEFAAQVADEYQRLLGSLGSSQLRSIAHWKMEGDTTDQIAAKLHCARSTVERRLRLIRGLWKQESLL
jgi:DNA-directed RNA polymerase specialized sigma24 family protein